MALKLVRPCVSTVTFHPGSVRRQLSAAVSQVWLLCQNRDALALGHADVSSRVATAAVVGAAGVQGAVDRAAGLSLVEATGGV